MVEMSDVKDLTPEELMLKVTMEKVRSAPRDQGNRGTNIPPTTVTHGYPPTPSSSGTEGEGSMAEGELQMNGARALYGAAFYSTSALRAMDVLRRYPPLGAVFENRLLVAEALEKAGLKGEALNEYVSLSGRANLSAAQTSLLGERIAKLRTQ